MTILLLQIFLLMLAAFLAGAVTAYLFRRAFFGRSASAPAVAAQHAHRAPTGAPIGQAGETGSGIRFEKALTGGSAAAVPPPFQLSGAPMIEVQPAPKAAPPSPPRVAAPSSLPQAAAAPSTPRVAVPPSSPRVAAPSQPAPQAAPAATPQAVAPPAAQPAPKAAPAATPVQPAIPALPAQPAMPTPPTRQAVPLQSSSAPPVAKAAAQPETPPASYFAAAAAAAAAVAKSAPEQRTAELARSGDDLTRIRAIDIETQKRLREIGIHSFADIAKWTPADVGRVSQTLGTSGRIEKENWVEQAQILVRGSEGMDAGRKADVADKQRPAPQPASTFGSPFGADRLHRIIGICGDTEKLLNANGVTRFADIASWTGTEIEKIEALLGKPGRVGLENWVEQAKILSRSATGEDLRATKLDEAIRNNAVKPATAAPPAMPATAAPPAMPATAAPPAPGPQLATPAAAPGGHAAPRDVAHLRSVRSEALRREPLGAAASAIGVFDDLKRIRGVGMLIEKKLNSLGITAYEQIANWTGADIDRISQVLDFKGRIERENWIEQARILASGGATDFSRRADRG